MGKASARWRRGVIYNHINPFTFYAGLGHCHFCPRGEWHNPTYKRHPINIWDDEPYPYLQTRYGDRPTAHLCSLWPWITGPLVRVKSTSIIYSTQWQLGRHENEISQAVTLRHGDRELMRSIPYSTVMQQRTPGAALAPLLPPNKLRSVRWSGSGRVMSV